jgi:hypothetical protein
VTEFHIWCSERVVIVRFDYFLYFYIDCFLPFSGTTPFTSNLALCPVLMVYISDFHITLPV